ncbi:protein artemis-like [Spodoptera litura]|uniref:Protein artemis-like n=1 Tax=Spodoptera litura TaxID=69820 RepID=A0A9J7IWV3_SPOLT|nr:protein artemis-like [Spodoptera litura]
MGSFSGFVQELHFIRIDNFIRKEYVYAYFLSHYHGDHIHGIEDKELSIYLKNNKVYIYTSEVTVAIITARHPELAPYLRALKLGRNALSIQTEFKEELLEVTVLPAGHSFGSVMFLFEYEKQKIMFTGDFRISKDDVEKYTHLQNNGIPIQIDALYIDTTFQKEHYFPKRSEVVRELIPYITQWLDESDENRVNLGASAMFGYEGVCNQIYDAIKIKVKVEEDKWQIYRQFPKQIYGVTNEESRIVLKKWKYESLPLYTLDVRFFARGWPYENVEEECLRLNFRNLYSWVINRIEVCYSTHCGRDDFIHFIKYLKPTKIEGFPLYYMRGSYLDFYSFLTAENSDANENFEILPKRRRIIGRKNDKGNCQGPDIVTRKLSEVLDW